MTNTFEYRSKDPSESLEHYGIKGMKWGVRRYRNEDGSLTKAGYRHNANMLRKAYNKNAKDIAKNGAGTKTLEKGRKRLNKLDLYREAMSNTSAEREAARSASAKLRSHEEAYYNNKHLVNKYQKKAAKADAKRFGGDKKEILGGYRRGDLDQGNSFDMYLKKDKKAASAYNQDAKEFWKANENLRNAAKSQVDTYLGKYGNKKLRSGSSVTVGEKFVNSIILGDDGKRR